MGSVTMAQPPTASPAAPAGDASGAAARVLSRTGILFALIGAAGLILPLVQFRANRIVAGEMLRLPAAIPSGALWAALIAALLALNLWAGLPLRARLAVAAAGLALAVAVLGAASAAQLPPDSRAARISPSSGFWLLSLAFALMAADAFGRMRPGLRARWAMLAGSVAAVLGVLASGWLDSSSVMVEYAARQAQFGRALAQHLGLALGSLALALLVGLPVGVAIFLRPRLRRTVLSVLNMLQTVPSLALFGVMIPLFGWIAASVPGAADLGVAGIGPFPALMALFLYALLPVVSNTLIGLTGVDPAVREAALGVGMTRGQVLRQVQIPLALPVIVAAVRIVLVQNIGLAVIAGLIGGGGFGTFVFQGLNQTAMDLILLGALPTIFLALIAGVALDLIVRGLDTAGGPR